MFAQLGCTIVLHRCAQLASYVCKGTKLARFDSVPYMRTLVTLFVFSYNRVTTSVLLYMQVSLTSMASCLTAALQCVDVGSSHVVFSVPSIDCSPGNAKYQAWLAVTILLFIAWVVALPCAMIVFLCRNRDKIARGEKFAAILSPLHEAYRPDRYYAEIVSLLRRTALICIDVFLVFQPRWRSTIFALLLFVLFVLHLWMTPFRRSIENTLEALTLVLLIVIAVILTGQDPPLSASVKAILSVLVVVPMALLIFYVVAAKVHKKWPISCMAHLFTDSSNTTPQPPSCTTPVSNASKKVLVTRAG